jgi:hypothetical protein
MYNQIISRVEGTLRTLGIEASEAKTEEGQYNITNEKNTEILVDVWEQEQKVFFQVMSRVKTLSDEKDADVLKSLLEENHALVEACFTLINNEIFIKETIECNAFFNQERALSTITRIAYYCDIYKTKWPETQ